MTGSSLGIAVSSGAAGGYAVTNIEGVRTASASTSTAASGTSAVTTSAGTATSSAGAGATITVKTAGASLGGHSSGNIGLGFAIPMDHVKRVLSTLGVRL